MKFCLVIAAFALVTRSCRGRAVEESVVSDYTGAGAGSTPSVYSQIANNLAEKITQPFYRFLGISNSTAPTRPFEHIELQDPETTTRDVEELSTQALTKIEKKPEKITLFTSYLPLPQGASEKVASGKLETFNQTKNEVDSEVDSDDFDDDFSLDDDEGEKPRGPFVYILELMGSVIQLLWGGFLAIFRPPTSSR